jgi:hypothetical protein
VLVNVHPVPAAEGLDDPVDREPRAFCETCGLDRSALREDAEEHQLQALGLLIEVLGAAGQPLGGLGDVE